ncbi:M23 family metallopeptidase, partial [Phascolarctobacterium faecium]
AQPQALPVTEGQSLKTGQVLSHAGSTGWSTGPHCHFEVRIHGEVTEPLDYLP